MIKRKLTRLSAVLATTLMFAVVPAAQAQSYPDKPVKMVVGFAPGGPTDILARILAKTLSTTLGANVLVDNRAGAGGMIGTQQAAKADPDGYTILFAGDGQLTLLPQLNKNAGYDTNKDFVAVRQIVGQSNVLLVNKSSGITDVPGLLAKAKASPGKINYGSGGNGTPSHLIGVLLEGSTGIELLHIPYKGAAPAMTDLIGGQLDMMFVGMPVALQQATRENLKVLAVTGDKRNSSLPDTPTFAELGVKGLGAETAVWWAVMAPAGTPPAIQAKLSQAIKAAMADPELRATYAKQGVDILDQDGAVTMKRVAVDQARWAELIRQKKISAE